MPLPQYDTQSGDGGGIVTVTELTELLSQLPEKTRHVWVTAQARKGKMLIDGGCITQGGKGYHVVEVEGSNSYDVEVQ